MSTLAVPIPRQRVVLATVRPAPGQPSWHARYSAPIRPDLAGLGRHRRTAPPPWSAILLALLDGYVRPALALAVLTAVSLLLGVVVLLGWVDPS